MYTTYCYINCVYHTVFTIDHTVYPQYEPRVLTFPGHSVYMNLQHNKKHVNHQRICVRGVSFAVLN